ncbi:ABC-type phosphate/phosphonate transport system periplasmic component [Nitrosococcus halophilus Nc 4]|uniref:ABC-type phosphate/phosphonate transport system periplasmic component n=1 Tax=Nitrosococcus halophilus (strain Nc4) TaxID=472759 RepID=D5BY41_NITHN|nr:phosphate/phosphite/phosphonate ABC transporter substrate-binding protein [Nitrosococcus halophilus]ADE15952.1 ABC-type phosphate/phosphonate transport system periplasmic component [Nitrosococcus halophilus Nc 4]
MPYNFTVSPDFTPDHLSGWYIFNTWLQKALGEAVHLEMYNDFKTQRDAIEAGKVDLIYANPYDASMLVREKGFTALVKPKGESDEATIAVNANNPTKSVEDLEAGVKVAITNDPDVHMMGLIMLEPADLNSANIQLNIRDNYIMVAKDLLRGESDVGIFLAEAFDNLSSVVKNQLRVLVNSQIHVIHHSLMLGPALAAKQEILLQALMDMMEDEKGQGVLKSLGFSGWEPVDQENTEFMIDLMDTLMV